MKTVRRPRIVMAFAATALLAACASPGYNAGKLEKQLVDAGLTTKQATCVTNALENTFDQGQMGSRVPPDKITQREFEKTRSILLKACEVDPRKLNPID